jgi:tetratricopeptide (TPR) repeat protein
MNVVRTATFITSALVLAVGVGCSPRKQVTERDRKEAAVLVSEAQFALTVREWPRAEGLLAKAVQLAPQGDYYLTLGAARLRQGNRAGTKQAYEAALKEYEIEAARNKTAPEPWLKQAYVLALLGRKDDSRALISKAAQRFPNEAKVRALLEPAEFEKMITSRNFKDSAL